MFSLLLKDLISDFILCLDGRQMCDTHRHLVKSKGASSIENVHIIMRGNVFLPTLQFCQRCVANKGLPKNIITGAQLFDWNLNDCRISYRLSNLHDLFPL